MEQAERDKRNLYPHKAAKLAMCLWAHEYAYNQKGGSMDFWDGLTEGRKQTCRDILAQIMSSKDEPK